MNQRLISLVSGMSFGALACLLAWTDPVPSLYVLSAPYCSVALAEPTIAAEAGYAVDLTTGTTLFNKNADVQLPLASLTKLMTVATALDTLSATSTVTITHEALSPEGDSGLKAGERWYANDLASFTLMESSNDGAHALMLAASGTLVESIDDFIAAMNRKAAALGLASTYYMNDTGLDISTSTAGAYGTAHDMAALVAALTKTRSALLERSTYAGYDFVSQSGVRHAAKNTSLVASTLMASVASKTGYTDLAGGNLVVEFEPLPGRPVAISVLGSTRDGRDADVRAIARFAEASVRRGIVCSEQL